MKYNELAREYFPNVAPQSATVQLKRWVDANRQLRTKLMGAGWSSGQKLLTPKQVEIFKMELGEPRK